MQVLAKRHFVRRRQTGEFGIDVAQCVHGGHSGRGRLPEGFARSAPTWRERRAGNLLKRTAWDIFGWRGNGVGDLGSGGKLFYGFRRVRRAPLHGLRSSSSSEDFS